MANGRKKERQKSNLGKLLSGFINENTIKKTVIYLLINLAIILGFVIFFDTEAFTTIVSVVLGFFLSKIAVTFFETIRIIMEDKKKCKRDNEFLNKIYPGDAYKKEIASLDESSKVHFLYEVLVPYKKDVNISLIDDSKTMFSPDILIKNYYAEIFGAHKSSYVENHITLRLDKVVPLNGGYEIHTSRSNYYNHLVTNRAIDYPIKNGLTLRGMFEYGPRLVPLENSLMSNHLGVNVIIELADHSVIFPKREINSTTSKNLVTASIASRINLDDPTKKLTSIQDIHEMIKGLMDARLGISQSEIKDNSDFVFLGLGRDVYEGGKPHFFYYIRLKELTSDSFLKTFNTKLAAQKAKDEHYMDMDKMVYLCNLDTIHFVDDSFNIKMACVASSIKGKYNKVIKVKPEMSFFSNLHHYRQYQEAQKVGSIDNNNKGM